MSLDAGDLAEQIPQNELLWALGSICALHRLPFDAGLAAREFPPPTTHATLVAAARALKLRIKEIRPRLDRIGSLVFPLLIALRRRDGDAAGPSLGIITAAKDDKVVLFRAGSNTPQALSLDELADEFIGSKGMGKAWLAAPEPEAVADPDAAGVSRSFGFRWFVPELLKHRKVWRDVLLASLALQLIALATPLFTQAIIDKVVVHRTQSTLMAIGVAMLLFTAFSGVLGWVRQYLVLHTGNRACQPQARSQGGA